MAVVLGCGRDRTNWQLHLHFCKYIFLAEEMRTGSKVSEIFRKTRVNSVKYVIHYDGPTWHFAWVEGQHSPFLEWMTRHLCLVQLGFNKLLSLPFHFIPLADTHKFHCEINAVLKWSLTYFILIRIFTKLFHQIFFLPWVHSLRIILSFV